MVFMNKIIERNFNTPETIMGSLKSNSTLGEPYKFMENFR